MFAVFPCPRILIAVASVLVRAKAMACAILPLSDVHISVDPLECAVAMQFTILKFSDVYISVGQRICVRRRVEE